MTQMSTDMQDVLAEIAEEFAQAEVFNQWMPPDGTYTALITGYNDGVSTKGSSRYAWWKLDGRLLVEGDPELDGKDFTLGFFRSTALGFLKQAMSVFAGRKIDDVRQAQPILSGAVDCLVTLKKTTTIRSEAKGGGEFPNVTILEVIPQTDSGAGQEVETPTAEPTEATNVE